MAKNFAPFDNASLDRRAIKNKCGTTTPPVKAATLAMAAKVAKGLFVYRCRSRDASMAACRCERGPGTVSYRYEDAAARDRQPSARSPATYDYTDAQRRADLTKSCAMSRKDSGSGGPDPDKPGEWIWNLEGVKARTYRLPDNAASRRQTRSCSCRRRKKIV